MALPAENIRCSYADYLAWEEDRRMELLEGNPVMLASPSRVHQEIEAELVRQLGNYLADKKRCRVYPGPFAVRLFEAAGEPPEEVDTVVEPDVTVVCDPAKLDDRGCKGAPDFVIEILSPSTRRNDRLTKFDLYQRAGVREYWIVSPEERAVQVFLRQGDSLKPREYYQREDPARVEVLENCTIDLTAVFPE